MTWGFRALLCRLGSRNTRRLRSFQPIPNSGSVRSCSKSWLRETHPECGSVDRRVVLVDLGLYLARHYSPGFISQCGGAMGGHMHRFAVSHSYTSCLCPRHRVESRVPDSLSKHEWLMEALKQFFPARLQCWFTRAGVYLLQSRVSLIHFLWLSAFFLAFISCSRSETIIQW